jgi:hypothetical protein
MGKTVKRVKTYTFTGDIRHPGSVTVRAANKEEAIALMEAGEFSVFNEQNNCLGFDWNGDNIEQG